MMDKSKRTAGYPIALPVLLVFLPVLVFYGALAVWTRNLPLRDDYDTILQFANVLADQGTIVGKISFFLAQQSNEYKLYLLHAAVWSQWAVTHHVNFRVLIGVGDAFVLLLGLLLWKEFPVRGEDLRRKLMLFVPVSCLLFQLRYEEAADWSTAALQHLPGLFFSFAALFLLYAPGKAKFFVALGCMTLAISSSGNGFLLLPVGLLALLRTRRYLRSMLWTVTAAGCATVYFHHYTRVNLQAKQSLLSSLSQIHPTYFFLFLGSIVARPSLAVGMLLGLAVCAFLAYQALRGGLPKETSTAYCLLYLLLIALGVASFRGDVDAAQISTSRYTIYSALLLIFCWFVILEKVGRGHGDRNPPRFLIATVVTTSVLFAASTYLTGVRGIRHTDQELLQGMTSFEHPQTGEEDRGPVVPLLIDNAEQREFRARAREELRRSIQLGVYTPPQL